MSWLLTGSFGLTRERGCPVATGPTPGGRVTWRCELPGWRTWLAIEVGRTQVGRSRRAATVRESSQALQASPMSARYGAGPKK